MHAILVLYYSLHGSTKMLANQIARGIEMEGLTAIVRTVPPVSNQLDTNAASVPEKGDPYVTQAEWQECAALALGSPVRFGNMSAAMKYFIDGTASDWMNGTQIGKPACVFASSSSMHGGQESTLLSMQLPLLHHGMLLMGLPYSNSELSSTRSGGTPYGVTHVAHNNQSHHQLTAEEQALCIAQGRRLAIITKKLNS